MISDAFVDLHGAVRARICYHVAGDGPPVLLLHGWGASWYLWQDTMRTLAAAGRRVYAPDHIGCGQSSKPRLLYTPQNYSAYVDAFVSALGLGNLIVAGHSLGGHLALAYALRHPQRTEKLVLLAPAFSPLRQLTATRAEALLALAALPLLGELALALTPERALRWCIGQPWGGFYQPERLSRQMLDRVAADYLRHTTPLVCNTIRYLVLCSLPGVSWLRRDADLLPAAAAVTAPTLLVWGEHDALLRPPAYRALAARLPHVTALPIAEAGHSPHVEAADEFQRALLAFIHA